MRYMHLTTARTKAIVNPYDALQQQANKKHNT